MLDLAPETESRVQEYAAQEGVSADEAINRLLGFTQTGLRPEGTTNPMLRLLQEQLRKVENATSEEVADADAAYYQWQQNMNENRRVNGERLLFPEIAQP